MARIRSIKPDFWTDEKVVELSAFARLLFIGLWNFVDDEGRMVYSPKRIKMQIFPSDSVDISELIGEIRGKEMITVYVVDGVEYLQVNNFSRHQKVDKRTPSKFPAQDVVPPNPTESRRNVAPEGKGVEGKGVEGKGVEGKGVEGGGRKATHKTELPKNFTVSDRVRAWAEENKIYNVDAHLEPFILKAQAKRYTYSNWDSAFIGAIRDDWAKLGKGQPGGRKAFVV